MKVSIIIPNFNGKKLLEKNLPKVMAACKRYGEKDCEVIVVDDASSDESVSFLKENYPQIKLIIHKKNQQFAISCNDGVVAAKSDIVVLLNNDVAPKEDFLKPLMKNFADEEVFSVGCKEKSLKNGQVIFSGRAGGKFQRGFLVHWRAQDQHQKNTLWTASGSAAYPKSLWQKFGGLDPLFRPAYGEDLDLSYRAQKSGYKVLFEPESEVFHQHETTNLPVFGKKKILLFGIKNQLLFVWKNITDLKLLVLHFFWLPYHLFFDTLKTKGLFLLSFLLALKQLPEALINRQKVIEDFTKRDEAVLQGFGEIIRDE